MRRARLRQREATGCNVWIISIFGNSEDLAKLRRIDAGKSKKALEFDAASIDQLKVAWTGADHVGFSLQDLNQRIADDAKMLKDPSTSDYDKLSQDIHEAVNAAGQIGARGIVAGINDQLKSEGSSNRVWLKSLSRDTTPKGTYRIVNANTGDFVDAEEHPF